MDVEYRDKQQLALAESDRATEIKLPVAVINSLRQKLVVIHAALDDRVLRNWKSLHYEKLEGDKEGQRSIRLNNKWRLVFELDLQCKPSRMTILAVEDYH